MGRRRHPRANSSPVPAPCFTAILLRWLLGAAALLVGCSSKGNGPTAPVAHRISGVVEMTMILRTGTGDSIGTSQLADLDSVPVTLLEDSAAIASTSTSLGVYRFAGLGNGRYRAFTPLYGTIADTTATITLAGADVVCPDTLELGHRGDLQVRPNPAAGSAIITYRLSATGAVTLAVVTVAGSPVVTLVSQVLPPGAYEFTWDGKDGQGNTVRAGFYWVLFQQGTDYRCDLIREL
jgi:flagellar hook capping protein FlgD